MVNSQSLTFFQWHLTVDHSLLWSTFWSSVFCYFIGSSFLVCITNSSSCLWPSLGELSFHSLDLFLSTHSLGGLIHIDVEGFQFISRSQTFPLNSKSIYPTAHLTSLLEYVTGFFNQTSDISSKNLLCSWFLPIAGNHNFILLIAQDKSLGVKLASSLSCILHIRFCQSILFLPSRYSQHVVISYPFT